MQKVADQVQKVNLIMQHCHVSIRMAVNHTFCLEMLVLSLLSVEIKNMFFGPVTFSYIVCRKFFWFSWLLFSTLVHIVTGPFKFWRVLFGTNRKIWVIMDPYGSRWVLIWILMEKWRAQNVWSIVHRTNELPLNLSFPCPIKGLFLLQCDDRAASNIQYSK